MERSPLEGVKVAYALEQLGGFFLIEAKDMDEACAVAARFPPVRVAVIEIRPVQELMHSRAGIANITCLGDAGARPWAPSP